MDKKLLFKPRLREREVELEDVGTIRVRALSRDEMAEIREEHADEDDGVIVDRVAFEYALISRAMVDPELTVEDVAQWAKAAPGGEVLRVLDAVNELSGLDDLDGAKSVRPNRRQRRAAVRTRSRA